MTRFMILIISFVEFTDEKMKLKVQIEGGFIIDEAAF